MYKNNKAKGKPKENISERSRQAKKSRVKKMAWQNNDNKKPLTQL